MAPPHVASHRSQCVPSAHEAHVGPSGLPPQTLYGPSVRERLRCGSMVDDASLRLTCGLYDTASSGCRPLTRHI
eukprot:CAMPEP_0174367564 /NCGR_PEP_ID=MMETSP0811_2-20130205/85835_1 /TAXON_ID=73025 ORGANISM="Eutreptiella gymnastica-like, Strain CCMP1594" /NCGR_SAMPLE_ID=MMETSP0811_2 /ASSEMBLY_ACC=CAM_ASM_000667 /LENGTH=73 /DNA_ID=CAMNT_0015510285 /DNA_START=508 /DNA_END=729 /DNA_ORIENTATION=-